MTSKKKQTVIPIIKEEVTIAKKSSVGAVYKIAKTTSTENLVESIPLTSESVLIDEVEINKEIEAYPDIRNRDDVLIIPIVKEVEVITKKLVLVKEIHIRKTESISHKKVAYSKRYETVAIEKLSEDKSKSEV